MNKKYKVVNVYSGYGENDICGVDVVEGKSLNLQLIDIFDPVIGKVEKDYGKTATRSFIRDMFDEVHQNQHLAS